MINDNLDELERLQIRDADMYVYISNRVDQLEGLIDYWGKKSRISEEYIANKNGELQALKSLLDNYWKDIKV